MITGAAHVLATTDQEFIFQHLLTGDPRSWLYLIGGLTFAIGAGLAYEWYLKSRIDQACRELGGCELLWRPAGWFNRVFFVVQGERFGVPFAIESRRLGSYDYRTILTLNKPQDLAWESIEESLPTSAKVVTEEAARIAETPAFIELEYPGARVNSGDLRALLRGFADAIESAG